MKVNVESSAIYIFNESLVVYAFGCLRGPLCWSFSWQRPVRSASGYALVSMPPVLLLFPCVRLVRPVMKYRTALRENSSFHFRAHLPKSDTIHASRGKCLLQVSSLIEFNCWIRTPMCSKFWSTAVRERVSNACYCLVSRKLRCWLR
jgi:hypothetical protein